MKGRDRCRCLGAIVAKIAPLPNWKVLCDALPVNRSPSHVTRIGRVTFARVALPSSPSRTTSTKGAWCDEGLAQVRCFKGRKVLKAGGSLQDRRFPELFQPVNTFIRFARCNRACSNRANASRFYFRHVHEALSVATNGSPLNTGVPDLPTKSPNPPRIRSQNMVDVELPVPSVQRWFGWRPAFAATGHDRLLDLHLKLAACRVEG